MKRLLPGAPRRQDALARTLTRSSIWLAAASGLMSIFLLGCPGTLDAGVGPGPGGATGGATGSTGCEAVVFATSCAVVGCHATVTKTAGLDLGSANPASRLVGVDTAAVAAGGSCAGMKLLDMGSTPATGVLIDKITNSPPACGSTMPLGGMLNAADLACLTNWATTVTSPSAAFTGDSP